jgi:hypothetical protein
VTWVVKCGPRRIGDYPYLASNGGPGSAWSPTLDGAFRFNSVAEAVKIRASLVKCGDIRGRDEDVLRVVRLVPKRRVEAAVHDTAEGAQRLRAACERVEATKPTGALARWLDDNERATLEAKRRIDVERARAEEREAVAKFFDATARPFDARCIRSGAHREGAK